MRRTRIRRRLAPLLNGCDRGWQDSKDSAQRVGSGAPLAVCLKPKGRPWPMRASAKRCGGKNGKFSRWAVPTSLMDYAHKLRRRKSIFPDFLSNDPCPTEGWIELEIPVELTEGLSHKVMVMPSDELAHEDPSFADCNLQSPLSLTTLPPITLSLTLPLDYPLRRPPVISRLHAMYGWLPPEKLQTLEKTLLSVWEVERGQGSGEGRAILYDWVEMVRSAESCLGFLGLITSGDVLSVPPLDFGRAVCRFSFTQYQTPQPGLAYREVDFL